MRDTLFSGNNVLFARNYVWNARNDKLKRRYFYPINSFNQIILPMTSNFTAFLRPFRAACLFVLLTVCCGGCSDSGSVDETPPADQLALSYYYAFGTPVCVMRPFNTYGPRQSARAVIPTIITQIAAGKSQLKLGALHPTRDFNYVQDTVSGFIAMLHSDKAVGEVINIGSNYEISIGETAQLIAEVMGSSISIETDNVRLRPENSEVERLWADNQKAQRLLNWKPSYGAREGFKRGLQETVEWFTNADNLKRYKADIYNT